MLISREVVARVTRARAWPPSAPLRIPEWLVGDVVEVRQWCTEFLPAEPDGWSMRS